MGAIFWMCPVGDVCGNPSQGIRLPVGHESGEEVRAGNTSFSNVSILETFNAREWDNCEG